MGTRADFYIGIGDKAEWIGSVTHDGDAYSFGSGKFSECVARHGIFTARNEEDYRSLVASMIESRPGVGMPPEEGWPWSWNDSSKTDWAYVFYDNRVWGSDYHASFRDLSLPPSSEYPFIPEAAESLPYQVRDMSHIPKRLGFSGFMILGTF